MESRLAEWSTWCGYVRSRSEIAFRGIAQTGEASRVVFDRKNEHAITGVTFAALVLERWRSIATAPKGGEQGSG